MMRMRRPRKEEKKCQVCERAKVLILVGVVSFRNYERRNWGNAICIDIMIKYDEMEGVCAGTDCDR